MQSKEKLVKFLEKYHLSGIVESALIEVTEDTLKATVKSEGDDLRGHIELKEFEMNDGEIACYSTSSLLRLLSILDNDIQIVTSRREDDQVITALNIRDTKGKKVKYVTCDAGIVDRDGKKGQIKNYDVKISLNNEVIDDILRAYGALNSNITFLHKEGKFYAVLNYSHNNEDQIEIQLETESLNEEFDLMTFNAKYIKNILEVNKKRYVDAYIELSMKGIAKFYFEDTDSTAEYWVVKLQD